MAEEMMEEGLNNEADMNEFAGPSPAPQSAETENTASLAEMDDSDEESLDFFNDVPLVVSAELGRLSIKIKELLALGESSVLELDKLAGEPLEIMVNNKLICRGEVIVINEKYGIRMTDIVSPGEKGDAAKRSIQGN